MSTLRARSGKSHLQMAWAAATERGRRPRNEDRYGVGFGPSGTLLAVADGLGGHRAGAVAAERVMHRCLGAARRGRGLRDLPAFAAGLSQELELRGRTDPACDGLGTTLSAVLLEGERGRLVACGDSRIYLLRDGYLRLMAEPHELTRILVREGVLSAEESLKSPVRGRLTSYLGMKSPEIIGKSFELRDGDRLALVTDGVLEGGESRLSGVLSGENLERVARDLVRGIPTHDNATAVVAAINLAEGPCLAS